MVVVGVPGYAMRAADLAPFAESMGVAGEFYFPDAPISVEPSGRAWWPIDQERRRIALTAGPRDLAAESPPGAPAARERLAEFVRVVRERHRSLPLVLLGFSQGGMLACDAILHEAVRVDGLALLSSSRIDAAMWERLADRLRDLPVLVSHGDADDDLAFAAGERLRDFCIGAGARVRWVPFAGSHGIPLVVWREVRRFLKELAAGQ